jgi:hypothetical protein
MSGVRNLGVGLLVCGAAIGVGLTMHGMSDHTAHGVKQEAPAEAAGKGPFARMEAQDRADVPTATPTPTPSPTASALSTPTPTPTILPNDKPEDRALPAVTRPKDGQRATGAWQDFDKGTLQCGVNARPAVDKDPYGNWWAYCEPALVQ